MKKNLFLRLCLMMVVVLSFNSCRQDILPEQETYSNSGAFQLTSKRISLNEARHKAKLLPEIEQVEKGFKTFSATNAQGKIVNYGNGVSIDTENVIFIENGPNYHTYTFAITKANAAADAPVENLVLTPLPDGTYKELLVTYDLTAAEKLQAENGIPINTHGKVQITELAKGTYNNNGNLQNKQIIGMTCGWTEEIQFTVCDGNDHHSNGELIKELGGPCTAANPSVPITVAVYKCDWIYAEGNPFSAAGPGVPISQPGGTPGGGGGSTSGSCSENGIFTAPIDPTTNTNMECETGVPTQIIAISPELKNKCDKAKDAYENTVVKSQYEILKNKTSAAKESGYGFKTVTAANGTTSTEATPLNPDATNPDGMDMGVSPTTFGYAHTHLNKFDGNMAIKIHSPADINTFINILRNAKNNGIPLANVFGGMIASDPDTQYNVYQLLYTGKGSDLPPVFSKAQLLKLKNEYTRKAQEINLETGEPLTHYEMQKLFWETLKKMNVKNVVLSKREYNTGKFYIVEFDEYGTPTEKLCP